MSLSLFYHSLDSYDVSRSLPLTLSLGLASSSQSKLGKDPSGHPRCPEEGLFLFPDPPDPESAALESSFGTSRLHVFELSNSHLHAHRTHVKRLFLL